MKKDVINLTDDQAMLFCAQHQGSRSYQQDQYIACRRGDGCGILAVLCDGMGGMSFGERFSGIGIEFMVRSFWNRELCPAGMPMEKVLRTCHRVTQKTALAAQSEDSREMGGSTLLAVLMRGNKFSFLSSGDSRIYLYRSGLIQLTRDQNLGCILDERAAMGVIDWSVAEQSQARRSITGSLGDPGAAPPVTPGEEISLRKGDLILLMTDGVYGTLPDKEIDQIIQSSPKDISEAIIDAVLEKKLPAQDNCSVMVLQYCGTGTEVN